MDAGTVRDRSVRHGFATRTGRGRAALGALWLPLLALLAHGSATAVTAAPTEPTQPSAAPVDRVSALSDGGDSSLVLTERRPGVWVHTGAVDDWLPSNGGDVANLGVIAGSRCVAVIDTGGTPALGTQLLAAVRRVTPLPVCFVVNTHMHPDHVLGNRPFADLANGGTAPQFIGHARLPAAFAARERFYLNALQRDFGIPAAQAALVYPTRTVTGRAELELGDRIVQVDAWPTAHTDNDLTVYDRKTKTLFASDLLFRSHLPVLDGKLRGWLSVLDALAAFDVALVVPGHGEPSSDWPGAMQPERAYLNALLTQTRQAIRNRETIQQAVAHVANDEAAHWRLSNQFHKRNITAAYAELEWED